MYTRFLELGITFPIPSGFTKLTGESFHARTHKVLTAARHQGVYRFAPRRV
jgi:hypothetical protein